jgi:hypothetical protein
MLIMPKKGSFFQYCGLERKINAQAEEVGVDFFERSGRLTYYYAVRLTDAALEISSRESIDSHIFQVVHKLMDDRVAAGDESFEPFRGTLKNKNGIGTLKIYAERASFERLRKCQAPPPPYYCQEGHCFLVFVFAADEGDFGSFEDRIFGDL